MKGYIYITDKVVVNPYERPNANNYFDFTMDKEFKLAKKVWEFNNIEVENVKSSFGVTGIKIGQAFYALTPDGSPCTYKMSGDKAVVLTLKT